MYNVTTLKADLIGLIGWRQNPDPGGTQVYDMLTSESGMWYNEQHPLLTHDNLLSIAPNFSLNTYPAWNNSTAYQIGQIVTLSGTKYRCTVENTNQTPPNNDFWEVYYPYTVWLKEKTEGYIIEAVERWFGEKVRDKTARNLLDRDTLLKTSVGVTKDTNNDKIVGYEIVPVRYRGLKMVIEKISVQFDENCEVMAYLYQSNTNEPVGETSFSYTGNGYAQWVTVNWEISGEGSYYVAYDQAENSGVQSINGVSDNNHVYLGLNHIPVGRFFNVRAFEATPYSTIGIGEMEIENDFIVGGSKAFGSENLAYTIDTNYGLNFKFTVNCDYTEFISDQRSIFKTLIAKSVAIGFLHELYHNPNSNINRNAANVNKDALWIEMYGNPQSNNPSPNCIAGKIETALDAAKMDTTGIDPLCLPCRRRSVKYRSM